MILSFSSITEAPDYWILNNKANTLALKFTPKQNGNCYTFLKKRNSHFEFNGKVFRDYETVINAEKKQ